MKKKSSASEFRLRRCCNRCTAVVANHMTRRSDQHVDWLLKQHHTARRLHQQVCCKLVRMRKPFWKSRCSQARRRKLGAIEAEFTDQTMCPLTPPHNPVLIAHHARFCLNVASFHQGSTEHFAPWT